MKLKSSILLLTAALLLNTTMATMAQDNAQSSMPELFDPAMAAEKPLEPNHVMAVVDGKNVTVAQLDAMASDIDPALARLPDQQRRLTVLKVYIDMKVLANAAVKEKLDETKDYKDRMQIMRENVLQQIYFKDNVLDKITDADIEARYKTEVAALPKEQEVHARHILVKTKEEAEALIARLNKGEKFEDLAKESSTDGSAAMGGDLGYFSRGQMVKPFEDAAFSLKIGAYTKTPIESPFGWHIIKLEDLRDKLPPSLADVKDSLISMIARDRYKEVITKLRQDANVTFPDKNIATLMQEPEAGTSLPGETPDEEEE